MVVTAVLALLLSLLAGVLLLIRRLDRATESLIRDIDAIDRSRWAARSIAIRAGATRRSVERVRHR
ncbi:MAG: hypothetical protein ACERLM_04620 [Acidimicrobiales bacterium]